MTIDTSAAGQRSGAVTFAMTSDGTGINTLGQTTLPDRSVDVQGTVYRLAEASMPAVIDLGIVHVQDSVQRGITINNAAPADGYSEALNASVAATTAGLAASGSLTGLGAGASSMNDIVITLDTSAATTVDGAVDLSLVSDGAGLNTLGITDLGQQSVQVLATVNAYAEPTLEQTGGDASLTREDDHRYVADFGTLDLDDAASLVMRLLNDTTGPSDELAGVFDLPGGPFSASGFTGNVRLVGGTSLNDLTLTLEPLDLGEISSTLTFLGRSQNASGYDRALTPLTVELRGRVVPEPSVGLVMLTIGLWGATRRR